MASHHPISLKLLRAELEAFTTQLYAEVVHGPTPADIAQRLAVAVLTEWWGKLMARLTTPTRLFTLSFTSTQALALVLFYHGRPCDPTRHDHDILRRILDTIQRHAVSAAAVRQPRVVPLPV